MGSFTPVATSLPLQMVPLPVARLAGAAVSLDSVGADGILIAVVLPAATVVVLCLQGKKERTPFQLESLTLEKVAGTHQVRMQVATMRWDLEISAALRCMLLSSLHGRLSVREVKRFIKWQWFLSAALPGPLLLFPASEFLQRLQSRVLKGWQGGGWLILHLYFLLKHLTVSEDTFGCHALRKVMLLASSGWRAGMLLSVQQCTGPCTTTENSTSLTCQQSQGWETFLQGWKKRKGKETNPQERVHGFFRTCWLETLEASWVESETGLHTKRARRPKKEANTPDC